MAFPGPVSNARMSPFSPIQVTLPTPPRLSTASGFVSVAANAEHAAQPLAKLRRIGHGQRRTDRDKRRAVALDRRDIDAIERGPAHQPERPAKICRWFCAR